MTGERSGAALKHLRTLLNEGTSGHLTDRELLARFVAERGEAAEAAFAVLVERHAPMVLEVCRQLLGDVHDAQDASQATFLVLAKKAHSIRRPEAISSWLHGVALRVAAKAKVAAARRRAHERRGGEMAARSEGDSDRSEHWPELHDEIDRLPERYRLPVVLCYLEGLTHGQAAHRLRWPVGTVESRLARARARLRQRLGRHGAMPAVALLGARSLAGGAGGAVAPAWIEATARAATWFAAGQTAATLATTNVAFLTQGTLKTMALTQLRLAMAYALAAGLVATGTIAVLRAASGKAPQQSAAIVRQAPQAPAAERPKAVLPPLAVTTLKISGRVLDPEGKPRPQARLWLAFQGTDWTWSTRVPEVRAATGPDGRFAFTVSDADREVSRALRATSGWPDGFGGIHVIATAEGFGPGWTRLAEAKGEIELRLTPDDVPIEGRLLTLEGRPIAGVAVRALRVEDLSNPAQAVFGAPSGFFQSATTDTDGRFRLPGIGRGRRATLGIAGPGIARDYVQVVTGTRPADHPSRSGGVPQFAAKFEHPCKPGKSISGVVRDIDTGAPLPGITVRSNFGTDVRVTTDQRGRYRIDGLSKLPTYHLIAGTREGDQPYITSEQMAEDSPGYDPMNMDLGMLRGVVVRGRLIDRATGRPVQAWVDYVALRDNPNWARVPGLQSPGNSYYPRPWRHVPAMADGSFRLVALPGRGFLVAHIQYQSDRFIPAGLPSKGRPGAPPDALEPVYDTVPSQLFPHHFPAVLPIDIAPGTESFTRDLMFDSGVVRTGTVLDPAGRPLSGANMIGETYNNTTHFAALDGPHFTVYALSPSPLLPRTLIFRHAERGLGKALRVDAGDRGPLEVQLEPLAAVAGRLVDQAGRPRQGAELRLLRVVNEPLRSSNGEFSPPLRATTDRDGRFRLDAVVPGVTHSLQAPSIKPDVPFFVLENWTPKAGEVKDLGEIAPKVEK